MSTQGEYRYSTRTVIAVSAIALVLGVVLWIVGAATGVAVIAIIGFFGTLFGIIGTPVGLVREAREKRA